MVFLLDFVAENVRIAEYALKKRKNVFHYHYIPTMVTKVDIALNVAPS